MSFINYSSKTIRHLIAYAGPQQEMREYTARTLHRMLEENVEVETEKLTNLAVGASAFYFSFKAKKPLENGFSVSFDIKVLPEDRLWETSRRLMLKSIDALVFITSGYVRDLSDTAESVNFLAEDIISSGNTLKLPYFVHYVRQDNQRRPVNPKVKKAIRAAFQSNLPIEEYDLHQKDDQKIFAVLETVTAELLHQYTPAVSPLASPKQPPRVAVVK